MAMAPEVPSSPDRFDLIKDIQKTLQGRVHKARDRETDQIVAVKEAFIKLCEAGRSRDGTPVGENFPREKAIHAEISAYDDFPPSILRMIGQWEDAKSYFVVLEWAAGGEMFDFVKQTMERKQREIAGLRHHPQEPPTTLNPWQAKVQDMFKQLTLGVAWLHSKGISHRDLSLENTLMQDKDAGLIKIIDFGVALKFPTGDFTCDPARIGKLTYMAPEVYARQPYDARDADIWSMGVMLFMLLVGAPPYSRPIKRDAAFNYIFNGRVADVLKQWTRMPMVPRDALDLIVRIFRPAHLRIKMHEIWTHPWVNMEDPFPTFSAVE